jgi:Amt family ammonium transporter
VEGTVVELAYALDTFYFLVLAAFVMWMAAGFAMLEAGLVRSKSTVEILTKNVSLYAVACIMYMIVGYNIMYPGDGVTSWWPGISLFLGGDNTAEEVIASGGDIYYSNLSDFMFQVVFVATAMSIVSGAVAERMKLWAFLLFAIFMTAFIYPLQGFWHWGGGFLSSNFGYYDFAGSGTVHMAGAAAALAGVILLGARKGKYGADGQINAIPGANMPLATLGTFILWMGWFGFNGGSNLVVSNVEAANQTAMVFVNTNLAAAAGVVAALLTARLMFGKADLSMALNGALAGLVAITADPLSPTPGWAAIIGAIGGIIVVFSIIGLDRLKLDDPVGAISVHGTVGMWGIMAVLLSSGVNGATFMGQIIGLVTIFAWVFIASLIVWGIVKVVMGLRLSEEDEYAGADFAECGMEAYPEFTGSKK